MIASFRRLSKSAAGKLIMVVFFLLIMASFAMGDIASFKSGTFSFGSDALVKIGDQEVGDRDMSRAMERRLSEVRQQAPTADYSTIAADFEPLLKLVIDQKTLQAFADKFGFTLSKRLIDGEIANLPNARGLDGKFSEQAYANFLAQQRLTDKEVRALISGGVMQRLLLTPVATSTRVPVGYATPYAAMLLELRQGDVANIPSSAFRQGLKPTDADLQRYYAANRARYIVPEQRVLKMARIGPELVAGLAASEQEIAAYYKANQAAYGSKEIRVISQAVVPDQASANGVATRARGGATLQAAAAPVGSNAAVTSLGAQSRDAYSSLAGQKAAAAVFAAPSGSVVGPIQSDFGWIVAKVEQVRSEGGKSLAAAKPEIAAKLTADKRKEALTDLVTRIEDAIDDGSNLAEAAAAGKLQVTETPLITANGTDRANPAFRFPPELAPALKSGFELAPNDEPVIEALPNDAGYVLVAPSQVVAAAPAPLQDVRDKVAEGWINQQALARAKAIATAIAAKTGRGMPLAQAVKEAGVTLPPSRPVEMRRIEMTEMGTNVPAQLRMLFTLGEGKSRMVADPQSRGFSVVRVNKITPGNALTQPGLIGRVQSEFQQAIAEEYARQFLAAIRAELGVKRNEEAIAATKKRISGT